MVTVPLTLLDHVHQTDLPPALPAWLGSPDCLLAPTLVPETVVVAPLTVMVVGVAKLSLTGVVMMSSVTERLIVPLVPL